MRLIKNTIYDSQASLSETGWVGILNTIAPNKAYGSLVETFAKIYENSFPLKTIEKAKQNLLSPWVTKGLKNHLKENKNLNLFQLF